MTSQNEAAADIMVTCPPHYQAGPYECRAVEREISNKLNLFPGLDAYESRLYFAAFEYVWRAPFKGEFVRDLRKAAQDLNELADILERK